jgi:uncharacterized membrane protein YhaH (DUF805 family)
MARHNRRSRVVTRRWFRAKKYGWGWTPASIEGWLVLAAFVVLVALDAVVLRYRTQHGVPVFRALVSFYLRLAILVVALIVICLKTGEPPRWRWGK